MLCTDVQDGELVAARLVVLQEEPAYIVVANVRTMY